MSQLPIKNCYLERYNVKNGLANSDIGKLYIDSNDILWISTNTSVQIFDGSDFRTVINFDSKCLFTADENQEIQLINDSIVYKSNKDYSLSAKECKLTKIKLDTCIYVKNYIDHHYILCNNSQLYLWDSILIPLGERHNHSVVLEGPNDAISILHNDDYTIWQYQLNSKEIEQHKSPQLSPSSINRSINSAYIHGSYYITGTNSLYVLKGEKCIIIPYPDQIKAQYHTALCELNDSTAMVGIEQNLFLFDTNNNKWLLQYSDISNSEITTTGYISEIVKDNTGHIYIDTETEGLIKLYYDSPFEYIGDKSAKSNFVKSLMIDDHFNRVISACLDEGVKIYNKQGVLLSSVNKEDIPSKQLRVIGIYPFQEGKYLFYNNADMTLYSVGLDKDNNPIVMPFKKLDTNLYYEDHTAIDQSKSILLLNKIYQLDHIDGTITEVHDNIGTTCSEVFGDNLYIGGRNKLSVLHLKTQTVKEITLKNKGLIRGITAIDKNSLIYGCDQGIYRINLNDENSEQLYDKCIYGIIQDSKGLIWASGDNGLIRMDTNGQYNIINQEQGLQGHEFNTNCVAQDAQGKLYFGGTNGISAFHPNDVNHRSLIPHIYVKEMIVNDSLVKQMYMSTTMESIDLNHDENNIQFKLSAIGQKKSKAYSFQYQMEGIHKGWQSGKLTDDLTFNLSPGHYSFNFTADLSKAPSVNSITYIPLVILTPWYNSWWFISALLIGALGSLVFIFNSIQKRKHLKEKYEWDLKSNLQEERMRISRDLHDNIGSQLTYIVSSLDNMKYEINENDIALIDKINSINTFGRQTIEELRNTIWVLKKEEISIEELDLKINSYVHRCDSQVEDISINYKSELDHRSDLKIKSSSGIHLFRIIQEAIQNAVKHAKCEYIEVTSESNKQNLIIKIQDNGIGLKINDQSGYGMITMKDRANQIGARLEIISTAGTRIELRLPLQETT